MFTFLIINQNTITCPVSQMTFLFKRLFFSNIKPRCFSTPPYLSYNYYSQSNPFPMNKIKPVQRLSPLNKGHIKEVKWVPNTTTREK